MLHLPFPWTGYAEGRALSQGTDGVAVCYTYHFHGQDALRAVLCHQGTDGVAVCYTYHFHGQDALSAVLCHQGTDGVTVCYTYHFHGQDALRAVLCHQGIDGVDVALPHRLKHVVRKTAACARSLKHNNNSNEYLERLTRTGPKHLYVLYKYILSKFNAYMNAHTHAHTHARTHTDSHTL